MTRLEEAVLAFIGTAECRGQPLVAADIREFPSLEYAGMAEAVAGRAIVTIKGWNFLDRRPKE